MPGEIFDFEWFVHTDGYAWIESEFAADTSFPMTGTPPQGGGETPWLAARGEPSSLKLLDRRKYYPFRDHSCLFRVLAETGTDRDGITGFAERYGLLGFELDSGGSGPWIGIAEPVSAWRFEIRAMRQAVDLWDMVSDGDDAGIAAWFQPLVSIVRADREGPHNRRDGGGESSGREIEAGELRWLRTNAEIQDLFDEGEMKLVALSRVQAIVNERIAARVSPRMLWDSPARSSWGLYFVPSNLVGALWTQFAQAITENRDYRRCRQCDSWFEIDHYRARSNRFFCSNACRSKAYRERQQEAVTLADAGMTTDAIAARLGSDIVTVTKWIESR